MTRGGRIQGTTATHPPCPAAGVPHRRLPGSLRPRLLLLLCGVLLHGAGLGLAALFARQRRRRRRGRSCCRCCWGRRGGGARGGGRGRALGSRLPSAPPAPLSGVFEGQQRRMTPRPARSCTMMMMTRRTWRGHRMRGPTREKWRQREWQWTWRSGQGGRLRRPPRPLGSRRRWCWCCRHGDCHRACQTWLNQDRPPLLLLLLLLLLHCLGRRRHLSSPPPPPQQQTRHLHQSAAARGWSGRRATRACRG